MWTGWPLFGVVWLWLSEWRHQLAFTKSCETPYTVKRLRPRAIQIEQWSNGNEIEKFLHARACEFQSSILEYNKNHVTRGERTKIWEQPGMLINMPEAHDENLRFWRFSDLDLRRRWEVSRWKISRFWMLFGECLSLPNKEIGCKNVNWVSKACLARFQHGSHRWCQRKCERSWHGALLSTRVNEVFSTIEIVLPPSMTHQQA